MPPRSLLRLAPQRVLNTVAAAILLLTTPALAHVTPPPSPPVLVALDHSTVAAQLAPRLPLTVTFHDRMGTALLAPLPAPIPTHPGPTMNGYRAGDVAYIASEQSIVVFLTDGTAIPEHDLFLIGHVEDGPGDLANCRQNCAVELHASANP